MFEKANEFAQRTASNAQDALFDKLAHLDSTATSWFDETSNSVIERQRLLSSLSIDCRTAAASHTDDTEAAEFSELASDFAHQARQLQALVEELEDQAYEEYHGAPVFSSKSAGLSDESKTGATNTTDWDVFVSVEPRYFVAENSMAVDSTEEMRQRAYSYIDYETSGHGLSRSAKVEIAQNFLSAVEEERTKVASKARKTAKTSSKTEDDYPDSALFY